MQRGRIDQLKKFLENSPNDSFIKYALALEYVNQSQDEIALSYFEGLIKDDPGYTATYYHLGKLYERMNKMDLAVQTYESGLMRTKNTDVHAYNELKEALSLLKDVDE